MQPGGGGAGSGGGSGVGNGTAAAPGSTAPTPAAVLRSGPASTRWAHRGKLLCGLPCGGLSAGTGGTDGVEGSGMQCAAAAHQCGLVECGLSLC